MLKASISLLSLGLILSLTTMACSKDLGRPSVGATEFRTEGEPGKTSTEEESGKAKTEEGVGKTSTEDQLKIANIGLAQLEVLSLKLVKNNIHLDNIHLKMTGDEPMEDLDADLSEQKLNEIEKDLRTYIQITESLERMVQENPEIGDQGRKYNLLRMKRAKNTLNMVELAKKSKAQPEQKQAEVAAKDDKEKGSLLVQSGSYEVSVQEIIKLEEEVQESLATEYETKGIDLTIVSDEGFEKVKSLPLLEVQNLDLKIRNILGKIEEIEALRTQANLTELSAVAKAVEQNRLESLLAYQKVIARKALAIVD